MDNKPFFKPTNKRKGLRFGRKLIYFLFLFLRRVSIPEGKSPAGLENPA